FRSAGDQLVIPDHFIDREWNVLLRFERNDFLDFLLFNRGQLHETRKDRLRRDGVIDVAILDSHFAEHLANCRRDLRLLNPLTRWIDQDLAQSISPKHQAAMWLRTKFRQPDRLRPEIEAENA